MHANNALLCMLTMRFYVGQGCAFILTNKAHPCLRRSASFYGEEAHIPKCLIYC